MRACLVANAVTGHPGVASAIYVNSFQSGLLRLEQLIQEAGVTPIPEAIVEAVNLVVFIQKNNQGKKGRRVTSMLKLNGYDKNKGYLTVRVDTV